MTFLRCPSRIFVFAFRSGHYMDNLNISAPGVVAQHVFMASNLNQFHLSPINLLHPDTGVVGVYLSAVRNYSTGRFRRTEEDVAQVKLNVAEKVNEMTKEHLLIIDKAANFANTTLRMLQGAVVIVLVALGGVGVELAVLAYKVDGVEKSIGMLEQNIGHIGGRLDIMEQNIGLLLKKAGVKEEEG